MKKAAGMWTLAGLGALGISLLLPLSQSHATQESNRPLETKEEAAPVGKPQAQSPVPKPATIPAPLKATFSKDGKVTAEVRRKELETLGMNTRDPECATALRWLVHQADTDDELRGQALITLGMWNAEWLVEDLQNMLKDPAQSETWKVLCITHLGLHHSNYIDEPSYKALAGLAGGEVPAFRDAAMLRLAKLDREFGWERVQPPRHAKLLEQITKALSDSRPAAAVHGAQAVAFMELREKAADLERLVLDEKQPNEVRVAAANALSAVAREESLAVLDACTQSSHAPLAEAAKTSRTFALAAQLKSPDAAVREKAFNELSGLKELASPALVKILQALDGEETDQQRYAKTLLSKMWLEKCSMPPLDRKGMTHLGEDAKEKNPGVAGVLLNPEKKLIALDAEIALEFGTLEYAVVCKGENAKLHETMLALSCAPLDVCYALLACNYTYAGELRENGRIRLPKGAGVMLSVEYEHQMLTPKGLEKKLIRVPLEMLIWNSQTGHPMKQAPWAFTGSRMQKMPDGKEVLMAVVLKSIVAIKTDPDAILNTCLDSADSADVNPQEGAYYEVNRMLAPKHGTPCHLIFEPWTGDKLKAEDVHDKKGEVDSTPAPNPGTEP